MRTEGDASALSAMQQGLFFNSLLAPGSGVDMVQFVFDLPEEVDAGRLREAWQRAVDRHPILRSSFHAEGTRGPVLVVHEGVPVPFHEHDWRGVDDQEARLRAFLLEDRREGVEFGRAPLLRFNLFRLADRVWKLVWTWHHALLDGHSVNLLVREVFAAYEALRGGDEPEEEEAPSFAEYVAWAAAQDGSGAEKHWRALLAGFAAPTPLPLDRASGLPFLAENYREQLTSLDSATTLGLRALAAAHGLTPNTVVQGAWALVLARHTGSDDVVFGNIRSGRRSSLESAPRIMGPLIYNVPVRVRVPDGERLIPWLHALREQHVSVRGHEHSPLLDIRSWSDVPVGAPLFESGIVFDNSSLRARFRALGGDWARRDVSILRQPSFPLTVAGFFEAEDRLCLRLSYYTDRFDHATIEAMLGRLRYLLEQMVADPDRRLAELELAPPAERDRVVVDWNRTASGYPRDIPVHQLVADQARRTPDAPAIAGSLTYAELDARADRLALRLREHGVSLESRVGVLLERGPEWVVALLAILKAGGAYVPLDPEYPAERLAFMLRDSGAALLIGDALTARLPDPPCAVMRVDDADRAIGTGVTALGTSVPGEIAPGASAPGVPAPGASAPGVPAPAASAPGGEPPGWNHGKPAEAGSYAAEPVREGGLRVPAAVSTAGDGPREGRREGRRDGWPTGTTTSQNLAYVVYTSGSTGTPKGVAVPHRAVVRLVSGSDFAPLGEGDVVAQVSNASFDAATWELWGALTSGASLAIVPRDTLLDPRAFSALLLRQRVTALFLTTALFNQVARHEPAAFQGVRHLLVGGEQADPAAMRRVLEAGAPRRLLNVYGPTENTTFSTWHVVDGVEEGAHTVPIGRPVAQSTAYVLDGALRPVPAGVWGELYLGGDGVARGYLGRPALTAERFVPDAFSAEPGARLYRTGDRVRWRLEGALEFGGRFDQQIKVRGFRIEPGEIEAVLLGHPEITEAAVVAVEDGGEHRLVGYVAPAGAAPGELRAYLRERLPDYMLPSALVPLDRLPLTPNGKLDRARLPAPVHAPPAGDGAPRTPDEAAMAEIWAEVLGLERVGVDDDFFTIGGHSLLAVMITNRVRETLRLELPLHVIFRSPTVARLAAELGALRSAPSLPGLAPRSREALRIQLPAR